MSVALARLSQPLFFSPITHSFFPLVSFPYPIYSFKEVSFSCDYYKGEDLRSDDTGKIIMRSTNRRGKQLKELLIEVI